MSERTLKDEILGGLFYGALSAVMLFFGLYAGRKVGYWEGWQKGHEEHPVVKDGCTARPALITCTVPLSESSIQQLSKEFSIRVPAPAAHPVMPEDERLKYFLQGRNQQKLEQVAKCEPPWVLSVERINGIDHLTCTAPAGLSLPPGEWSCSEHGCAPLWLSKSAAPPKMFYGLTQPKN